MGHGMRCVPYYDSCVTVWRITFPSADPQKGLLFGLRLRCLAWMGASGGSEGHLLLGGELLDPFAQLARLDAGVAGASGLDARALGAAHCLTDDLLLEVVVVARALGAELGCLGGLGRAADAAIAARAA